MKRVIIVHGWDGSPEEPMLAFIAKEAEKLGLQVVAPRMPHPDAPTIKNWTDHLARAVGEVREEDIFIGHSMGTQTIMRFLASQKEKPAKIILIAGFFNLHNFESAEVEEIAKPWLETLIDFEKLKNVAKDITVFLSDNDPFVEVKETKEAFKKNLNAKIIVEHEKGHYTEDDGALTHEGVVELLK